MYGVIHFEIQREIVVCAQMRSSQEWHSIHKIIPIDPSQKGKACVLGCQKEHWFHLITEEKCAYTPHLSLEQIHGLGKFKHTELIPMLIVLMREVEWGRGKELNYQETIVKRHYNNCQETLNFNTLFWGPEFMCGEVTFTCWINAFISRCLNCQTQNMVVERKPRYFFFYYGGSFRQIKL